MLTLNEPSRRLANSVVHEVIHRQETRVIVAELHTTAYLRQYSRNLSQVPPRFDIDGRGNDIKGFRGARENGSRKSRILV